MKDVGATARPYEPSPNGGVAVDLLVMRACVFKTARVKELYN